MFPEIMRRVARTATAFYFVIGVALLPGIAAGVAVMAYAQQNYFPIMEEFELDEAVYDAKGDIVLSGSFEKAYPDWACEYKSMNWYLKAVDKKGREIRFRVSSKFGDARPKADNNNRHKGKNYFHGWEIGVSEHPKMQDLGGYVAHTCLGFISTRTYFPPITIPVRPLSQFIWSKEIIEGTE